MQVGNPRYLTRCYTKLLPKYASKSIYAMSCTEVQTTRVGFGYLIVSTELDVRGNPVTCYHLRTHTQTPNYAANATLNLRGAAPVRIARYVKSRSRR